MAPTLNPRDGSTTFAELLKRRAEQQSDQVAFTFLNHEIEKADTLTFQQLYRGALRAAASLSDCAGKPALLMFPPGPQLITAVFGCFISGAIAVPARPPHLNRLQRADPRLAAVAQDARAAVVLTTQELAAAEQRGRSPERPLYGLTKRVVDAQIDVSQFVPPRPPKPQQPAMIQYTSGSTATPRGVVLSHESLMANQEQMRQWLGTSKADRFLSWLPPYHDMGLIGAILHPVFLGARCWLMNPTDFARRPARWLEAVSRYHATISGGPDFAYSLCARSMTKQERARLDLKRWRIAFNGAQPVLHQTMEDFSSTFADAGFAKEALTPCYGLAEATLFVCGSAPEAEPVYMSLDRTALTRHHVMPPEEGTDPLLIPSCGIPKVDVEIVHLATGKPCEEGRVGEIWLRGSATANQYHHRPGQTEAVFRAKLGDDAEWLRTGDLGFRKDEHLFVTGREKEMIIIRGRNHYPQDIEWTTETALGPLIQGRGVAFSVDVDGEEQLVVGWELEAEGLDTEMMADTVRAEIAAEHGITAHEILFLSPRSIPYTTSGKIKRRTCRSLYLQDQLNVTARFACDTRLGADQSTELSRTLSAVPTDGHRLHLLTDFLAQTVGRALQLAPESLSLEKPLIALGLDSLAALEISHHVEEELNCSISVSALLENISISAAATRIMNDWQKESPLMHLVSTQAPLGRHPLSFKQRDIWKRSSTRGIHNIAFAARLPRNFDQHALHQALVDLHQRHSMLRTTIGIHDGEPFQQIHREMPMKLEEMDARSWSEEELREHLADEAHHPLGEGPFWRVLLFHRRNEGPVMLWVADPVALDLWSLALLVDEFGQLYHDLVMEIPSQLPSTTLNFTDFVHWQEHLLEGPEGRLTWHFWKKLLYQPPAKLTLPTDRPHTHLPTRRANVFDFQLDAHLVWEMESFARSQGITLCSVLMAAWFFLLQRYSSQDDIIVGTTCTGRERSALHSLVGPMSNLLPIRMELHGNPRFADFAQRLQKLLFRALDHQAFPYALMRQRLADITDEYIGDLCQTMFLYQGRPPLGDAGLSSFALGSQASSMNLHGLELQSVSFEQRTTSHELTLTVVETRQGGDFSASLEYRADLFNQTSMARMAEHYINLLHALMEEPNLHADEWHLLARHEREQLLLNDGRRIRKRRTCLHQLFQKQAQRSSEHMHVIHGDRSWSYAHLNEMANRVAHFLVQQGMGPETPVGICHERGLELVAAVLGVLKAGAVLVPLLPEGRYPVDELAKSANCQLVLCPSYLAHLFEDTTIHLDFVRGPIAEAPHHNPEVPMSPSSLANMRLEENTKRWIYISHANLIQLPSALAAHMEMNDHLTRKPVWCASSSLADTGGVAELLLPLALGLKLVIADPKPLTAEVNQRLLKHRDRALDFSLAWEDLRNDASQNVTTYLPNLCRFADKGSYVALWLAGSRQQERVNPLIWATQAAISSDRIRIRFAGNMVSTNQDDDRDWSLIRTLSNDRVDRGFALPSDADPGKLTESLWCHVTPDEDAFVQAGTLGAHVLLRANGVEMPDLGSWIEQYRKACKDNGHEPGKVTFMLPVWLSWTSDQWPEQLLPTYRRWLRSQGYEKSVARTMARATLDQPRATQALFGLPGQCALLVDELKGMGVDELACEVAFGLPEPLVLKHLPLLNLLVDRVGRIRKGQPEQSFKDHLARHRVTHAHCNESGMHLLASMTESPETLVHLLLSGPEPDEATLDELSHLSSVTISYLHGQGETTTSALIRRLGKGTDELGEPLANTHAYVIDESLQPLPPDVVGELAVGGDGVCRGYGRHPALTAARFVPDPFGDELGGRLFLTGLKVKHLADGSFEPVDD